MRRHIKKGQVLGQFVRLGERGDDKVGRCRDEHEVGHAQPSRRKGRFRRGPVREHEVGFHPK
jgi:hypothetical protein